MNLEFVSDLSKILRRSLPCSNTGEGGVRVAPSGARTARLAFKANRGLAVRAWAKAGFGAVKPPDHIVDIFTPQALRLRASMNRDIAATFPPRNCCRASGYSDRGRK